MKVIIKIILGILAIGGVCYWLLGKFAEPAARIREYRRFREEEAEQELTTPNGDDEKE